jgi:hypothetical protein
MNMRAGTSWLNLALDVALDVALLISLTVPCSCSSSSADGRGIDSGASGADDASVADASQPADAGAADSAMTESDATDGASELEAAAPTCGPPPNRFTLLSGADAGLVRDNVTELVWMSNSVGGQQSSQQTQTLAAAYCTGRGMRLPTKDEALALAAAYSPCAFGQWGTWTSTAVGSTGDAWVVDYLGEASPQLADNFPSAVLCVRDPKG